MTEDRDPRFSELDRLIAAEITPKRRRRAPMSRRKYSRKFACGGHLRIRVYPENEIPHGTFTGYNTRGCRCQVCRDFMAANVRRRVGK